MEILRDNEYEGLKNDLQFTKQQIKDMNQLRRNIHELQSIRDKATEDIIEIYHYLLEEQLYTSELLEEIKAFFRSLGREEEMEYGE